MNLAIKDDENWEDVELEISICLEPSYNDRIELALEAWKQDSYYAESQGQSLLWVLIL
jgi:hypothetical protein